MSAAEIRADKARAREEQVQGPPPPPTLRSKDNVLELLGALKHAEGLYREGSHDGAAEAFDQFHDTRTGASAKLTDQRGPTPSREQLAAVKKPGRFQEEEKPMPKARSTDDVLSLIGNLKHAEKLYSEGRKDEAAEAFDQTHHTTMSQAPEAPPQPPKPAPKPKPPPKKPTPRRSAGSGGLDDLFGGDPNEGRVRVGRVKPKRGPEVIDGDD